jgi:hypothetical protein
VPLVSCQGEPPACTLINAAGARYKYMDALRQTRQGPDVTQPPGADARPVRTGRRAVPWLISSPLISRSLISKLGGIPPGIGANPSGAGDVVFCLAALSGCFVWLIGLADRGRRTGLRSVEGDRLL